MRILIIVGDPVLGAVLKVVVGGQTTETQIIIAPEELVDFRVRDERGKSISIFDPIEWAEVVITSHPNHSVVAWIQGLTRVGRKRFLCVLAESVAIPVSAITLGFFKDMWPQIAEAIETQLRATS